MRYTTFGVTGWQILHGTATITQSLTLECLLLTLGQYSHLTLFITKSRGNLTLDYILPLLTYDALMNYINNKHGLSPSKIQHINIYALQSYLSKLKKFQRVSIVKMIHNWIPTYSILCQQGREKSALCPRCLSSVETYEHVQKCQDPGAISTRQNLLNIYLHHLLRARTPIYLLAKQHMNTNFLCYSTFHAIPLLTFPLQYLIMLG